ncbi:MAG: 2-succinyl-5-enolpyruvyl-6-hydroxy-3-cyclohexene-1-carboxylic-acid synthase [Lentimicrobium sp.]|nr:2-succinyl-5-enolpyruvyl-6-hydroxy-3-cyclohexene-1-carboxylic-acid synthase [Lentimicrobium sp.]
MKNKQLHLLAAVLSAKGVKQVVTSPGSRNAPAIVVLNRFPGMQLHSIADERSAGFYALGIAQQLQEPVAVLCTSGSAALNYAPAIAEAYYQKIPLIVITADRPEMWIDQGDGQTIRQRNVFAGYIRKSYHLPAEINHADQKRYFARLVAEAADRAIFPAKGPVHINLPLAEPLYDIEWTEEEALPVPPRVLPSTSSLGKSALEELAELWNQSTGKIIIAGQMTPDADVVHLMSRFADDPSVVILSETTSNLPGIDSIACIDRTIEGIKEEEFDILRPQILLSVGGAVVSKKIKALLRNIRPANHWHVSDDPEEFHMDTYGALTLTIPVETKTFLRQLLDVRVFKESGFRELWSAKSKNRQLLHEKYLAEAPYSDLLVFKQIFEVLPADFQLHLGNSTPVRYAQLFDEASKFTTWSNRGTSGIDGSVSTAAGAAAASNVPVVLITGDIGFLYDSNALWNSGLSYNLRIILINNGGGNIFRVIPGPDRYEELEHFIETRHQHTAEGIAKTFGLNYSTANSADELKPALNHLFGKQHQKAAILEIFTPNKQSAEVLKDYFKYISK